MLVTREFGAHERDEGRADELVIVVRPDFRVKVVDAVFLDVIGRGHRDWHAQVVGGQHVHDLVAVLRREIVDDDATPSPQRVATQRIEAGAEGGRSESAIEEPSLAWLHGSSARGGGEQYERQDSGSHEVPLSERDGEQPSSARRR